MRRIGLYDTPTNSTANNYLGLYRRNDLMDFEGVDSKLDDLIEKFYSRAFETMNVILNDDNLELIIRLYILLKKHAWKGDIIAFCDDEIPLELEGFSFIGCDICADSMYYSPLGDGFFDSIDDCNSVFWRNMKPELRAKCASELNQNGIIDTLATAKQFAVYCNEINQVYPHIIELEDGWRPFEIFQYKEV